MNFLFIWPPLLVERGKYVVLCVCVCVSVRIYIQEARIHFVAPNGKSAFALPKMVWFSNIHILNIHDFAEVGVRMNPYTYQTFPPDNITKSSEFAIAFFFLYDHLSAHCIHFIRCYDDDWNREVEREWKH